MSKKAESPKREGEWGAGVGSMFKGLANLVEKLGDLAEKGEELKKSGQFETKEGLRGTYGFNVRMGGPKGEEVRVEPFGNLRRDVRSGESEVQEVREPVWNLNDDNWELEGPDWLLPILGQDRYHELFARLCAVDVGGDEI